MNGPGLFVVGGGGAAPLGKPQQECDRMQADIRGQAKRPLIRPLPPHRVPLTPTSDLMLRRLADEVEYMQRIIQSVGASLAADTTVVARHAVSLQQFDVVSQVLGHVAAVLSTDERNEAVGRIGMADLRARLKRRSIQPG